MLRSNSLYSLFTIFSSTHIAHCIFNQLWLDAGCHILVIVSEKSHTSSSTIYALSTCKEKKLKKNRNCESGNYSMKENTVWQWSQLSCVIIMKYKGSFCWTLNYRVHCKHSVNELCLHIVIHLFFFIFRWRNFFSCPTKSFYC